MTALATFEAKDFKSELKPIWCPGCGDYGVLQGHLSGSVGDRSATPRDRLHLRHRLLEPHPRLHHRLRLQYRARPSVADRPRLEVGQPRSSGVVAGGDGDGFSIGGGHVAHAIRRNMDLTYIVMDNQVYGLTKGQLSPTSPKGLKTVTSAYGSLESPINPLL
jgi:2-oxoglutarate ferredoxin oxidoreductase subunit beta